MNLQRIKQSISNLAPSFLIAFFLTLLTVNPLTRLFFQKSFFGRNMYFKTAFFAAAYAIILFLMLKCWQGLLRFAWFRNWRDGILFSFDSFVARLKSDAAFRILCALVLIGSGVALHVVINHVFISIDTNSWKYVFTTTMPVMTPIGEDFRAGLYLPAQNLFVGRSLTEIWLNTTNTSGYPPLATLLGLLFLPFLVDSAYLIHVGLLSLANIASLLIAADLCRKYILEKSGLDALTVNLVSVFLFFAMLIYTFSSYGFAFSVERGNIDIYAIFFALLFLRLFIEKPEKLWLQVILLSIATHLKIYPAILFLLLFKRHGFKMLFPAALVNLILLLILGPNNALAFFNASAAAFGVGNRYAWIGNHSSYAFTHNLLETVFPNLAGAFYPAWALFTLIPLFIWGLAVFQLLKMKGEAQAALLFFAISVPVMSFVPTVSHDYKLVIFSPAVLILLAAILTHIRRDQGISGYVQLAFLFFILLFIGRSYVYDGLFGLEMLKNKYVWCLFLEGLTGFVIQREKCLPALVEVS